MTATASPAATAAGQPWRVAEAPGRLPFLGHAVPLRRRPLQFLTELSRHGDLVRLRLGGSPAWMVTHPDLIAQVLADPLLYDWGGPFYEKTALLMGNSLGNCPTADHRRLRKIVQPSFSRTRIGSYADTMSEEMVAEVRRWRPGATVDLNDATHAVTARAGARALMSTQMAQDAVDEILRALPIVMDGMYRRVVSPLPALQRLPLPSNRRFEQARARLNQLVDDIIAQYRAGGIDQGDLLSSLVFPGPDAGDDVLNDVEIHDHVMNFLMAATETSATALSWFFHEISQAPEVERQVQAEVDAIPAERPPGRADLAALPTVQRVINEVLRLYPPGWMMTRVVTADTELAGQRLPAGSVVVYSTYALQRDPKLFADPETFDPDRWLPERAIQVPRGAMIPFGGGSRRCIGDNFATTEVTLGVIAIARRWRLRGTGAKVEPLPRALTAMGPLPMITEPRDPAPRTSRPAVSAPVPDVAQPGGQCPVAH